MKKIVLIGFLAIFLTGCSARVVNEIDENGVLKFIQITEKDIPFYESFIQELTSNKVTTEHTEEECQKELRNFSSEIKNKKCSARFVVNREGDASQYGEEMVMVKDRITLSGEYKINSDNFIKKDGYILFNAKEVLEMSEKMTGKEITTDIDEGKALRLKIKGYYNLVLPGVPVNYEKMQLNLFKFSPNKDYFFVSRLGNKENPFKDKMTEENVRNIESLKIFISEEVAVSQKKEEIEENRQVKVRNARKQSHVQNVATIIKVSLVTEKLLNYDLTILKMEEYMKRQGYDLFAEKGDYTYAVSTDGKNFAIYVCKEETKELIISGTKEASDFIKQQNPCDSLITPMDPSDEEIAGYKILKIETKKDVEAMNEVVESVEEELVIPENKHKRGREESAETTDEAKIVAEPFHKSSRTLASTGNKSVIGNIIDSVLNFFGGLF